MIQYWRRLIIPENYSIFWQSHLKKKTWNLSWRLEFWFGLDIFRIDAFIRFSKSWKMLYAVAIFLNFNRPSRIKASILHSPFQTQITKIWKIKLRLWWVSLLGISCLMKIIYFLQIKHVKRLAGDTTLIATT